jgi:hypothetical protein
MDLQKQRTMIELLLQHSRNGNIDWKATGNANTILVSFNEESLLLTQLQSQQNPDEHDYRVQIVGPSGEVLDDFRDTDFEDVLEAYKRLHEIFDLGRRKAAGTDKAIDSIINQLNNILPF